MATFADSLLTRAGPDQGERWRVPLRWFCRFLLVHIAVSQFVTAGFASGLLSAAEFVTAALAAVALVPKLQRRVMPSVAAAAAVVLVTKILIGQDTANHHLLEVVLLAAFALCNPEDEHEGVALLQTLRWMLALVFFYSGLQKALHGYYFGGEFFAYLISLHERFRMVLGVLVPDQEIARLVAIRWGDGAGPFRADSSALVVLSNVVWICEMGVGLGLLLPRRRVLAALVGLVMLLGIELGARELGFGALMMNLFFLFLPGNWTKKTFGACVVFYLASAASHLGLIRLFEHAL